MKSILVVDDVTLNLKYAEEVLKDKYKVTAVRSGKEALAALKNISPDLILLDINMPDMDGFEVFEHIKANRNTADIPVAFITAETNREIEIKSIAMGAEEFIRKPFDPENLSQRVEKILARHHRETDSHHGASEAGVSYDVRQKNLKSIMAKADSGQVEGCFILINMDNFRQINSVFGTMAGDEVLTQTLAVLHEEVGDAGCLGHVGGDVFLLFLEGRLQRDYVRKVIRRILAGVEFEVNENLPDEYNITVSLSAGITLKPQDGDSFKSLYERADKALYYVSQRGKRSYHFYNSDTEEDRESDEKNQINILQLQRLFKGKEDTLTDSGENLQKAFRMVSRYWDSKEPIQMLLFSVTGSQEAAGDGEMEKTLAKVVTHSLRKGDAAVKCGKLQYLALLQNTSCENGDMVARRIKKKYEESIENDAALLNYEMKSILPQQ